MLISVISFLIIVVHFREVRSFEAVLVNGSLTIVDFDKACESSGFKIGDPKKIEGDEFTASINTTSREIDSLFGVMLEVFCPYVGYYRINETSKYDSTSPDTLADERPEEFSKVKNVSEYFDIETKSTLKYSTSTDKITPITEIKPDILPLLDITTSTTNKIIKTEPTIENEETTILDIISIVENVTESTHGLPRDSAGKNKNATSTPDILPVSNILEKTTIFDSETNTTDIKLVENVIESITLKGESVVKYKNVTFALDVSSISDISTKTTVADSESTTKRSDKTMDIIPRLLFLENVTEAITPKLDSEITNEIEDVSTTEITIPYYSESNSKNSSFYGYNKKETSTIKLLPEVITTESTLVPLRDVIKITDDKSTKFERTDHIEDITTKPEKFTTNKLATNSTIKLPSTISGVTKSESDATGDTEANKSSTIDMTIMSTSMYETNLFLLNSSTSAPVNEYLTVDDNNNTTTTIDYDSINDIMETSSDYETNDDDYTDKLKESSNIINGTMIYKHDTKSVDERRIVIVILFASILLPLIVVWTSKVLYRKQKGEYVLPQNMDNENIELGDNSD